MTNPADRIVHLPSGRPVRIVRLESPEPDLLVCDRCGSKLVQPVGWEAAGGGSWTITLRCPDCRASRTGLHAGSVVDRLDEEIDRGTDALVLELQRIARANMEDEIERFCRALGADQILPEDF